MNQTHGMYGTPEYTAFYNAKNRCQRSEDPRFNAYGGRGICMKFTDFEEFFSHIGPRPSANHTLDRIDTNGHYEAGNVRWLLGKDQPKTKRNVTVYDWNGAEMTLPEICETTGASYKNAWRRIKQYGWPLERAVEAI